MERKFQNENRNEENVPFGAPNSVNWLGNTFLVVKVLLLLIAYIWLFSALYQRLFG